MVGHIWEEQYTLLHQGWLDEVNVLHFSYYMNTIKQIEIKGHLYSNFFKRELGKIHNEWFMRIKMLLQKIASWVI